MRAVFCSSNGEKEYQKNVLCCAQCIIAYGWVTFRWWRYTHMQCNVEHPFADGSASDSISFDMSICIFQQIINAQWTDFLRIFPDSSIGIISHLTTQKKYHQWCSPSECLLGQVDHNFSSNRFGRTCKSSTGLQTDRSTKDDQRQGIFVSAILR